MRIAVITVCISLGLASSQLLLAGKQKGGGGGGGGKAAHAAGGGGKVGGGGAAHVGGSGQHGGSGFAHQGAKGSGVHQNGMGQHGLNAHNGTGHGLNAHNGLQSHHINNGFARRGNNFTGRNRFAGTRWNAAHWRASHGVFANYHRAWHDRWWWGSHYNRVSFVGGAYWGGYWYWDGGYWFPAWGYEPAYVGYVYDGPIYAYSNLPPDQVVVNVQEVLQDQGYYTGEVDGQMGSQTRDALSTYQRDHDLEITSAIDEPTVQSLGLVTAEQV